MSASDAISHQMADLRLVMFSHDFCPHLSDSAIEFNVKLRLNAIFFALRPKKIADA